MLYPTFTRMQPIERMASTSYPIQLPLRRLSRPLLSLRQNDSDNVSVRKRDTYANVAFFRFRLSFFATERCCLRLAAASGCAANCRTTRSTTVPHITPYIFTLVMRAVLRSRCTPNTV